MHFSPADLYLLPHSVPSPNSLNEIGSHELDILPVEFAFVSELDGLASHLHLFQQTLAGEMVHGLIHFGNLDEVLVGVVLLVLVGKLLLEAALVLGDLGVSVEQLPVFYVDFECLVFYILDFVSSWPVDINLLPHHILQNFMLNDVDQSVSHILNHARQPLLPFSNRTSRRHIGLNEPALELLINDEIKSKQFKAVRLVLHDLRHLREYLLSDISDLRQESLSPTDLSPFILRVLVTVLELLNQVIRRHHELMLVEKMLLLVVLLGLLGNRLLLLDAVVAEVSDLVV